MHSHTELTNFINGETTSHLNSQPDSPACTISLLPLTRLSGHESEEAKRSCLQTAMNSPTSIQHSFYLMASRQAQLDVKVTRLDPPLSMSADTSTTQEDSVAQLEHVTIDTPVSNANSQAMGKRAVLSRHEATYGMCPKYLWYSVWHAQDQGGTNIQAESLDCLADWTECAKPLSSVPSSELTNSVALDMIHHHPELFKIVTPNNVDHFETLLATHPNHPFVMSICQGL